MTHFDSLIMSFVFQHLHAKAVYLSKKNIIVMQCLENIQDFRADAWVPLVSEGVLKTSAHLKPFICLRARFYGVYLFTCHFDLAKPFFTNHKYLMRHLQ